MSSSKNEMSSSSEWLSAPLLEDEESSNDSYSNVNRDRRVLFAPTMEKGKLHRSVAFWVIICACIVSAASAIGNFSIVRAWKVARPRSDEEIVFSSKPLRYGNSYIGLDTAVLQDPTPIPPITNYPLYIGQVNASDPSKVYLDVRHWASNFGMVYQEDRSFLVSSQATRQVSTVIQFRTLDFGMERCSLMLVVPTSDELLADAEDTIIIIMSAASHVIPGKHIELESPEFHCAAGSLLTFEVTCTSPSCHLAFEQDVKSPTMAMYIVQYQSIFREDSIL
ncbi:hypothetical protein BDZ89DRAFT_1144086 [Hymenopellis radicata]|nr:hypothetical protein BDZ89DRAFT_1144086 [Hymenopellis radicata]